MNMIKIADWISFTYSHILYFSVPTVKVTTNLRLNFFLKRKHYSKRMCSANLEKVTISSKKSVLLFMSKTIGYRSNILCFLV